MLDIALHAIRLVGADGRLLQQATPSEVEVTQSIARLLDETPLCAWATVRVDGRSHIHIGYFAYSRRLELYLLSHPDSVHCRNLRTNASTAVALYPTDQRWTGPDRGMQLFGTCEEVRRESAATAETVYAGRFDAYREWRRTLRADDPGQKYRLWRFVPERLKILDEATFGDAVFVEAALTPDAMFPSEAKRI